ncbi:MAG: HDIG domain-containing protein [Firmicutes bacterium]|nr:HDIG domain-containing protein [Bacillota bacterium]
MRRKKRSRKSRGFAARVWRGLLFLAMALITWAILCINLNDGSVSLNEGDIADDDYFYQGVTTTYVSKILTEKAQNEAAESVEEQYVIDDAVAANLETTIDNYFSQVWKAATGELTINQLSDALPGSYTADILYSLIYLSENELLSLRDSFVSIVGDVYAEGVTESEIEDARQQIAVGIGSSAVSGNQELFLKKLNENMDYSYNKVFDAVATSELIDRVKASVEPVQVTVRQGERLVSRGQEVTADQIEALEALGLQGAAKVLPPFIGLLILVLVSYLILYFYIKIREKQFFERQMAIILLGVVMVVVLFICKLISLISMSSAFALSEQIGYLMPVAAASMVLAVLLDSDVAILCTVFLSVFSGIAMGGDMSFAVVAMAGGITGVITASRLNQRSQFVGASLYIILANVLVIGAWGLLGSKPYLDIAIGMGFGVVSGLLSAILAMGILPYLENAFGITTVIKLMELSNSNNPLLKRLMMEAPGTYNHSILVGNLAEAAANAIGADTLLVRVASYYHDIGKLKRPHFYIENQRPGDNPHDKLQPGLSAMIITSHTTDGAKMLRAERFPEEIIDIVQQHHGRSLLTGFYQKAKAQAMDPDEVKKTDYCYKGPKPQTREAAVVMLADSVQAAVQSLAAADKEAVETKVHAIIDAKVNDGQLSECPLTFGDLGKVYESFLMVLSGMNHQRIAYPELENVLPEGMATKAILQELGEGGGSSDR